MAYFGNQPFSASYLTDYFSGNNTTVAYTLTRAPVNAASIVVTVSGVKQAASTYGVNGTTLTFSDPPPSGTNNIEVLHLGVQPDTVVQPSYRTITEFTATAGQTVFTPASYTVGFIDVYRNGVKLGNTNFTATNGTTVVLANACAAGDFVRIESFLITSFNNAIPNTAGAVGTSLIADNSITTAKIVPGAVIQADLATGVAGTGPAFLAVGDGNQTCSHNTNVKLTFTSEQFDTNACYDPVNSRFTPNVAGYYFVYSFFSGQAPVTTNQAWTAMVYRNGSLYGPGTSNNVVTIRNALDWGSFGVRCQQLVYCNGTTDFIEIFAYHFDYSAATSKVASEKAFGAYMVRAA